jgi:hypothetical protein
MNKMSLLSSFLDLEGNTWVKQMDTIWTGVIWDISTKLEEKNDVCKELEKM